MELKSILNRSLSIDTFSVEKLRLLHSYAENGDLSNLKLFLEKDGDYILFGDPEENKTVLHIAAFHRNPKIAFKMVVAILSTPEAIEKFIFEEKECEKVTRVLLNRQDCIGDTALHNAAYMRNAEVVELLFNSGADLTMKNQDGIEQIRLIYKNVPGVIKRLLDRDVYFLNPRSYDDPIVYCLQMGHIVFMPNPEQDDVTLWTPETGSIFHILESEKVSRRSVLDHAVVRAFMHLKWKKIRYLIWFSIFWHALWLILYTMYIYDVFVVSCPYSSAALTSDVSFCQLNNRSYSTSLIVVLLIISATILLKELYELYTYGRKYLRNGENVCQLGILVLMVVTFFPMLDSLREWGEVCVRGIYYQIAAASITIAWSEMLLQVAKLPQLGIYNQILLKVMKTSALFFTLFSTLFVGFALGLQILLPQSKEYKGLHWSFCKLLVMMAGEIDFDEMFYNEKTTDSDAMALNSVPFPALTKIYYTLFVIMVTIILLNLLIATSVSNTRELFEHGEIQYLSNILQEIHLMETFILLPKIQRLFRPWIKYFMVVENPMDVNSYSVVKTHSELPSKIANRLREVAVQYDEPVDEEGQS